MTTPPTVRHRLEYGAYRALAGTLSLAPEALADRAGRGLGWLVARTVPIRWGLVMSQLARAFPEQPESWRRDVGRRSYEHLGAEAISMVRLAGAGADDIRERTRVEGFDLLERAVAAGRGVVVAAGHVGNWEIGAAAVAARGVPMDVVVARQRNRLFDERLTGARRSLGMEVIPRGQAPRRVLESLRSGRVVGIMGDQDARRAGIFVDFFGRPASTARGAAVLALRAGALLVLGVAIREPGSRARYSVHFEPVEVEPTGRLDEDVWALTQAYTHRLEAYIRRYPEQYFWLHRRWKTAPPEDPSGTGPAGGAYQDVQRNSGGVQP